MKIKKEEIFTVPSNGFAIGYSKSGYVLEYSADGENFTAFEKSTPRNEVCMVANCPKFITYRLKGNTDDNVFIQY